jgi:hypothetical protein
MFLCRIEFDYIFYVRLGLVHIIIKCIILPAQAEIDHLPWTYPNKEPTCLTLAYTWPYGPRSGDPQ